MFKKVVVFAVIACLLIVGNPFNGEANTQVQSAMFESFVYTTNDEGKEVAEYVVLMNDKGKTNRYQVSDDVYLYINNTSTTYEGFKYGMKVDITRNTFGKVTRLEGYSDIESGTIVENSKELVGTVVNIDPNGAYIAVKLDNGDTEDFYVTEETTFFKGTAHVDFSYMYEGDRVKMRFVSADTNELSEVEITQDGVIIENLYRATLNSVNTISNRMTVRGTSPFADWEFNSVSKLALKTFKFNNSTTIYVGNKPIKKSEMRNYRNSDVYFVTTKINNEEIVKKMIVLSNFERTFYDQINLINTSSKYFRLANSGIYNYHAGSILIRNGRLVEAASLTTAGSAFVLTDGKSSSKFTHIVNVTNDSFLSPNLANNELYFGMLSSYASNSYTVRATDMLQLTNNYWKATTTKQLSFSNNSIFTRNIGATKVLATDLAAVKSKYGYFFVKDGNIVTAHFLDSGDTRADKVLTGRVSTVATGATSMAISDVTQWKNGAWIQLANLQSLKLDKALIIKNGQVIEAKDIKRSDRVVLITDDQFDADIILVNE